VKYGVTDPKAVLRLAVQGHNLGHANPGNNPEYMADYPDSCARMGEWYFNAGKGGRLSDDTFTWTGNFAGYPTSYPAPVKGAGWAQNWAWFWTK
jgi:hypothetical protein